MGYRLPVQLYPHGATIPLGSRHIPLRSPRVAKQHCGAMSARGVRPAGAALAAIVVLGGAVGSATAAERALVARTGRARGITDSSAILAGTVRGGESVRYRFVFGTTRFYGQRTRWAVGRSGHGPVLVSAPLGSLRPATTYHYRLLARACSGCRAVSGADRAFTTAPLPGAAAPPTAPGASSPSPAAVPTAMTGASRSAGKTSATLAGEVNPERTTTSYYFAYGPTVAYGAQSPTQQAGAGDTAIA